MKYTYILFISLCLIHSKASSQSIERQVIGSMGGSISSPGVTMKTSVGEPVVGKVSNKEFMLSQGFFTGPPDAETIYLSVPEMKQPSIVIFPNPSVEGINLQGNTSLVCKVEIYNENGQKVYSRNYTSTNISINNLPAGLYIINFLNSNNEIQSSNKFIKIAQ